MIQNIFIYIYICGKCTYTLAPFSDLTLGGQIGYSSAAAQLSAAGQPAAAAAAAASYAAAQAAAVAAQAAPGKAKSSLSLGLISGR